MAPVTDRIRRAGLTPPDPEDVSPFSNIKRFLERWRADLQFRESFPRDPRAVSGSFGLKADPEEMRPFWHAESRQRLLRGEVAHAPVVQRFLAFQEQLSQHMIAMRRRLTIAAPRFDQWRQRQIYRTNLENGTSLALNPHIPASYELSRGCSVGCWFCSSSPPALGDVFRYTRENAKLWREILEAVAEIAGAAARMTICYSGTDPLDNPDYERFIADFAAIHGELPFTSTALPVRDCARTRALIGISGPNRLRFSVLSVGMLNKIHAAFTPEELLLVQIGLRNEGSIESRFLHFAGRARERLTTYRRHVPGDPHVDTPSCESGFKFNLPDRVIRLSSPCAPDDRWPMGYRVYDEARFQDAPDVRRILAGMIARHMPPEIGHSTIVRFQRCLNFEPSDHGFNLTSPHLRQRFENTPVTSFLGQLGALVHSGRHTAGQLVDRLAVESAAPPESVNEVLNRWFRLGVLDDEPALERSCCDG